MIHQLTFTRAASYDASQPGITVEVELSLGRERVPCQAKLDTGSTFCLFTREVGESLGIKIKDGLRRRIGTVTGNFDVYLHEVTLTVLSLELNALVGFTVNAGFQRNVLGRRGFLEQVALGLVDYEGRLFLSRYGEE